MQDGFSDVERRVKRYWYTDGIGELIGGGMFVLMGTYFALQEFLGQDSTLGGILQAGFVLLLIGGMFLGRRLIHFLKGRLTYPRTGYVEYHTTEKNTLSRILAGIIAMGLAMFLVVIARRLDSIDATVALTGVLVSVILLVNQIWSSRVLRFYTLSAVSLLLGIVLSVSHLPEGHNLGLFYGAMGIAFLISGGRTLQHYLRANPLPAEDSNG